jgi:hypothetical protein
MTYYPGIEKIHLSLIAREKPPHFDEETEND